MSKLEQEIFETQGGMQWEFFALYFLSSLPPWMQQKIENMTLLEFTEYQKSDEYTQEMLRRESLSKLSHTKEQR